MAGFISLPHNRIHKKEETKRLNNLPRNFVESFCKDWLDGKDFLQDIDFQQEPVKKHAEQGCKKIHFDNEQVWQRDTGGN